MREFCERFANCKTQFELHACAAHVQLSVAVLAQRNRPEEVHASYSHIWRKQKLHTSRQSLPMEAGMRVKSADPPSIPRSERAHGATRAETCILPRQPILRAHGAHLPEPT